jgi:hypothetical protein
MKAEKIRNTNATRSKPERIFRLIGLGRGRFITGELGDRFGSSGRHLEDFWNLCNGGDRCPRIVSHKLPARAPIRAVLEMRHA